MEIKLSKEKLLGLRVLAEGVSSDIDSLDYWRAQGRVICLSPRFAIDLIDDLEFYRAICVDIVGIREKARKAIDRSLSLVADRDEALTLRNDMADRLNNVLKEREELIALNKKLRDQIESDK